MTASAADFDALWDYEDLAATEETFRALLPQMTPGSPEHVQLLTQIARAQGLQGHVVEAQATLDGSAYC